MRTSLARALVTTAVCCSLTGCGHDYGPTTNAAPPTVVCGTTLSNSAAGAIVEDATRQPTPVITSVTAGSVILVRVSSSCDHGDNITLDPPDQARIVTTARAKDGLPTAVALQPVPDAHFQLRGTGHDTVDVEVHLPPYAFGTPAPSPHGSTAPDAPSIARSP